MFHMSLCLVVDSPTKKVSSSSSV